MSSTRTPPAPQSQSGSTFAQAGAPLQTPPQVSGNGNNNNNGALYGSARSVQAQQQRASSARSSGARSVQAQQQPAVQPASSARSVQQAAAAAAPVAAGIPRRRGFFQSPVRRIKQGLGLKHTYTRNARVKALSKQQVAQQNFNSIPIQKAQLIKNAINNIRAASSKHIRDFERLVAQRRAQLSANEQKLKNVANDIQRKLVKYANELATLRPS